MADTASPEDVLRRQLAALSDQFARRIEGELAAMETLADSLAALADTDARCAGLQALRDSLHRISGSSGTFGFAQLGQDARTVEQAASDCLAQVAAGSADLQALAAQVHALRQGSSQAPVAAPASPVAPRRLAPLDNHRIHILEDDFTSGMGMVMTLRNFGYEAAHYTAPDDFLAACRDNPPDALVVDIQADDGRGDGLAVAEAAQKVLPVPVPLLVITADDGFDTWLRAVRAGATAFFSKPVNLTELENRLERSFVQRTAEPYRVLIVDDDLPLAERYALVLRASGMRVEIEQRPNQVLDVMRSFQPEVLLLDVRMPGCSGPELAQIIRFHDDLLRVPIMYLSAETDIARQMEALLKAGDDFVTKPISDNALVATVFARAQRARLLSAALSRDSLTGLLKHGDIKEQLALEVTRCARGSKPASVVMIDIDHFKRVNDTYGHTVGDNVIRSLANLLRQRLRRADQLGRYGGEEFAAVLPDCPVADAFVLLDAIRRHFAELEFMADGHTFNVTLSAGLAQIVPGDTAVTPLERADRALYQAKAAGRNQVLVDEDGEGRERAA